MHIVLNGTYPSLQAERLGALLGGRHTITVFSDGASAEQKAPAFAEAEVIVTSRFTPSDPPAPRLKLLQSPSAGIEQIDMDSVPTGAFVATAQGHEVAMAEYVLCAMLDNVIAFRAFTRTFDKGGWHRGDWIDGPQHGELMGKTLGLLGYGLVARETARRAQAFGMNAVAMSRWSSGRPKDELLKRCYSMDERSGFLARLDFLLVTLPLSPGTTSLVDGTWFAEMDARTVLINVARGPVVEETALYEALRDRRIGGAVLDVWYNYPGKDGPKVPPSRYPFHDLDNVAMTPHGSGRTPGTFQRRWEKIAENIEAVAESRSPQSIARRPL